MPEAILKTKPAIRELTTIADLKCALELEKEVWEIEDADVTPLTLAVAAQASGSAGFSLRNP
jgi:predicted GNAT superfamily acetyltransferase